MNSLKTVLMVIVLAVVAGAVYVLVNNNDAASTPPPDVADGWSDPPSIEMPTSPTGNSPFNSPVGSGSLNPSTAGLGGMAPPFSPDQPSGGAAPGGMAPPFSPTAGPNDFSGRPPLSDSMPATDFSLVGAGASDVRGAFAGFMEAAHHDLEQGKLAEVHKTLSLWYDNPQLTEEESRQITELLDQVAGAVVYSPEHLLERPYTAKSGDTLQRIARAYGVPWQLLAKINRVQDPENLQPGQEVKVVRGPFDAVIHLDRHELTLMLGGLYAGRFPIGIGRDQESLEGDYYVEDKIVQPDEPNNPLGRYWIKLDDRIGLHGTNDTRNVGANDGPGSICLDNQDIEDVHDILSIGSRVRILR
ncbi:MAG: LysM peptidoglycan-binding domain-containing protein [Planctomycetota bacterium]